MKTPLRFLKKTALAAVFAASAATVCAATSLTQPRLAWFSQAATTATYTGDAPTIDNNVVEIDGDTVFTPSPASGTNATIQLTVSFSAFPTELPTTDMTGAQAAITAYDNSGVTNYYVYGKANSTDASATWLPVTAQGVAAPEVDTPVDVAIDIDYETGKATYVIDGTIAASVFLANGTATTSVGSLQFAGNGTISGTIVGTKGNATHTLGGANASYADNAAALAAALAAGNGALETWVPDTVNGGWTTVAAGSGTAAAPFLIRTVEDLQTLAALVQTTNCAGVVFQQANDIDFDGAAAFDGIGTYNATPTSGKPFAGTYDGDGNKILNVAFSDIPGDGKNNYRGIFNQVNGGTIKDLTVSNITFAATSGEFGGSIVGNAGNGATLQNLVSSGSFGSADKPGTHNMAGIVIRICGGTSGDGTQVLFCTNNATIYGSYTKLAGICAISQEKLSGSPKMVFTSCANNGNLVLIRNDSGVTGFAGIVGYSDVDTTMTDCSNTGTLTIEGSANNDHTGALIGMTYGHTITDGGNNSAPANTKMIGLWGSATENGFQYATVDNGVATTIAPPYTLVKDTPYLLEGDATPSFTLAAAGDTIAFDTALGYTLTDTGIGVAEGLLLNKSEPTAPDTVTTFTAAARPVRAVFLR